MNEMQKELTACCKRLKLSAMLAERAMEKENTDNQEFLLQLLRDEIDRRQQARRMKYLNTAGFPRRYSVEQYQTNEIDFPVGVSFQSLLNLDFLQKGNNVIMYGGTGTGKTMLSILIGQAACENGILVRFFRTAALINLFAEAKQKGQLTQLHKKLSTIQILILDEFGYVPYDRIGSQLLFDYISSIHEQKPIILNTNLEFSQWVNVLYDERMATALIGRLTHHVELILFPGGNYRLRESSMNDRMIRSNKRKEE